MSVHVRHILAPKALYRIGSRSKVVKSSITTHIESEVAKIDETFLNFLSDSDTKALQRYSTKPLPKSIRPNGPRTEDMVFSIGDTIWFFDNSSAFPQIETVKVGPANVGCRVLY